MLLLSSFVGVRAYAQLPNGKPLPNEWEYVGTIPDSAFNAPIAKKDYHFIGNKIIIPSSLDTADGVAGVIVSEDAGKTWSIRVFPFLTNGVTNGVNPISGTLYAVGRESDSVWRFYISYDLGVSFMRYEINNTLKYPNVPAPGFRSLNPHDTNDILLERSIQYGFDYGNDFYRSVDGGKTWKWVDYFPSAVDGSGQYSELTFDVRTPGLWYASVIGAYHGLTKTSHRSYNQGYTWEYIDHFGEYAGIGKEGELRNKWYYPGFINVRGFYNSFAFETQQEYVDWAKNALPNTPYAHGEDGYSIIINSYIYDHNNPHTAFFNLHESKRPVVTDTLSFGNVYIFRTDNDGETFEQINIDFDTSRNLGLVGFDEHSYIVYGFLSSGYEVGADSTKRYRYLVRRKLQKSLIPSSNANVVKIVNVKVSPNPSADMVEINYDIGNSANVRLDILSATGNIIRNIYDGYQQDGSQSLLWNIPNVIPSGNYMLRVKSGNEIVMTNLLVVR